MTDLTALPTLPAVARRGCKSVNCNVTAAVFGNKDLRQLEGKLKKWENELKLLEAKITDILGQKRNAAYKTYLVYGVLSAISSKRCVTV